MAWMDDEPVRGGYPDPRVLALRGLERMRAGLNAVTPPPPIHHLLGLRPVSAGAASVTFSMPCGPWLQTDVGPFFAGTAALVADAALGGAVLASLGPGKIVATSDLSINFLRPIGLASGQLVARARPIDVGNSLGLAEAVVEDATGRLVAHATTRCFIMTLDSPESADGLAPIELPQYETPDPYERPSDYKPPAPHVWEEITWLEYLERRDAGVYAPAPFTELFGMHDPKGEPGKFSCYMRSTPWHTSPGGTMYGGITAYFADAALAGAIATTLDKSEVSATLDTKVQFLRPVFPDGKDLLAEARVVHRGRTFATAQLEITNAEGKTVALATSSASIRSGCSWSAFVVADQATSVN